MTRPEGWPRKRYEIILADPPWHQVAYSEKGEGKSAKRHYDVMTLDQIAALPVAEISAVKGCLLFLWFPSNFVAAGHHGRILAAWGFEASAMGIWLKTMKSSIAFGTGYILRDSFETFVIGKRGKVPPINHDQRNSIIAPRREHSRKPDDMHTMIEALAPKATKLELFARQRRRGWRTWGNEVGKFSNTSVMSQSESKNANPAKARD